MSAKVGSPPDRRHEQGFYSLRPSAECDSYGVTAIDLFAGAGGLGLGLTNAGFQLRLAADIMPACAETHRLNCAGVPFHLGDLQTLEPTSILRMSDLLPGELDLLAGGPPCQGFSIIGERDRGDPRNALFQSFLNLASALRPKAILMENVTGLATMNKGEVLRDVGRAFDAAGYSLSCAEVLAAQYGVPQMRWRMIFIGWRKMDCGHLRHTGFPTPTHGGNRIGDLLPNRTVTAAESRGFLTTRDAIADLPAVGPGQSIAVYNGTATGPYQTAMRSGLTNQLFNHYAPAVSEKTLSRIRALSPGQDWRDLPPDLLPEGMKRALRKDHTRRFRRMTWDGVPRSIITKFRDPKSGEYTHPEQHRTITTREAARIQSLPDWFVLGGTNSQQYEQVGNAVPPLLARAIGEELREVMSGNVRAAGPPRSRYRIPVEHPVLFQES